MKKKGKSPFGGYNLTWPKVICFSVIMGIYTAIMALFVPDGNSFHDIAVTAEWWVLPAMFIIINSKKPLESAVKIFVFFLISQPLVYLIQVPFSSMGWGLFQYYPYWFGFTLLTFPASYICWFIKHDKWYSGIILSLVTIFLAIVGVNQFRAFLDTPPNHLVTVIYCFIMIPFLIFVLLKNKWPRIITVIITAVALFIYIPLTMGQPFETYNNTFIEENGIVFVGEPRISSWAGEAEGDIEIISYSDGYNFKVTGIHGKAYQFTISDVENEYHFQYYFDDELQTVVFKRTD